MSVHCWGGISHEGAGVLPPRNSDELWALVSGAWDEVASSQHYIRSLIGSMTLRMKSVVQQKGPGLLIKEVNF